MAAARFKQLDKLKLPLLIILVFSTNITPGVAVLDHVTVYPGTLPIILTSTHGGSLRPAVIPDRDSGCWDGENCIYNHICGTKDSDRCSVTTVKDLSTKELTLLLRERLFEIYGEYPPTVVNELHRRKLDANRLIDEAAFGIKEAEDAWMKFHGFINESKVLKERSLLLDIHGHGHKMQWAELGYLINDTLLESGDFNARNSSIRHLAESSALAFEELLRGNLSFGSLLEKEGYEAVPSPSKPHPDGNRYFSGGTITRIHGSLNGGKTNAIQIESPSSFRAKEEREFYAGALSRTIQNYMRIHYGFPKETNGNNNNGYMDKYLLIFCLFYVINM